MRSGESTRCIQPGPGLINTVLTRIFVPLDSLVQNVKPVDVEYEIIDGETLDFMRGLQAILALGHSAGQLTFLWSHDGGVLFAADACSNMFRLGYSIIYEDTDEEVRSLGKLSELEFETACFGHGRAILNSAGRHFKDNWGA